MPSTKATMRKERIERLLSELEYELVRGVTEAEIEEDMTWRYILPISRTFPNGAVIMEFRMRPVPHHAVPFPFEPQKANLRLVGEDS
jgi:hypothetical protein